MFNTKEQTKRLISRAQAQKVKGIILHVLKFCDPYVATKQDIKTILNDNGFSVLEIERDYAQSTEQLKTRLEAFREMII